MSSRNENETNEYDFAATIRGIIAVFITILVVIIIVMLFARSLFVSSSELEETTKTGHLTETRYVELATTTTAEEVVTTTEGKSASDDEDEDDDDDEDEESELDTDLPEGLDTSVAGTYVVNSAVYLHPESNSSSSTIMTLPTNAQVTVYGVEGSGWYYLEYEGQYGYAWHTYLTAQ